MPPATRRLTPAELAAIGLGPLIAQAQIDREESAATRRELAALADRSLRAIVLTLGATCLIGHALKAAGAL